MLKKTAFRASTAAMVFMLGACATQQPAPVVAGTASSGGTVATSTNNPYGETPYQPNTNNVPVANAGAGSYTPPVNTPSIGTYVPSYAPVDINAATHTVVRGDTVYNISKRYNVTQDNLKVWNNLGDNTISIGQNLRVKPSGYVASTTTVTNKPVVPTSISNPPISTTAPAPIVTAVEIGSTREVSGITWQRPTTGNVVTNFGGSSKGVDISGTLGQPVVAAADGKVVYAGSGLRGYGNLVIIQHNSTFLSAYGNNQSLLVNEGQMVKRGQTIAKMGNTDANRTQLHFEVRQNGKPVNPASYVAF